MNLNNKKILITGGAGFIGSHLTKSLLEEKSIVTIFDNFSTGKIENLKEIEKDVDIIRGDITDLRKLREATKNQDIIIHEAFPYGASARDLDKQFTEDGAVGTFNVLRTAVENNIKKVVYGSTVAVYGIQQYIPLDEKHPKDPFLPYGATKYVGELYCSSFASVYGLNTVSLRYFNVFGPRYATLDHSAMIHFLNQAKENKDLIIYGDGQQVRDYTYIDDVVNGTILATKGNTERGSVYNIGKGVGATIIDLARNIVNLTESKSKIRFAEKNEYRRTEKGLPYGVTEKTKEGFTDTRNYIADINKAVNELGYNPLISIDYGIQKTFNWLKEE